jgi:hypothetical protein
MGLAGRVTRLPAVPVGRHGPCCVAGRRACARESNSSCRSMEAGGCRCCMRRWRRWAIHRRVHVKSVANWCVCRARQRERERAREREREREGITHATETVCALPTQKERQRQRARYTGKRVGCPPRWRAAATVTHRQAERMSVVVVMPSHHQTDSVCACVCVREQATVQRVLHGCWVSCTEKCMHTCRGRDGEPQERLNEARSAPSSHFLGLHRTADYRCRIGSGSHEATCRHCYRGCAAARRGRDRGWCAGVASHRCWWRCDESSTMTSPFTWLRGATGGSHAALTTVLSLGAEVLMRHKRHLGDDGAQALPAHDGA